MENFYVYAHLEIKTKLPFYIGKGKENRIYSKKRNETWFEFTSFFISDFLTVYLTVNTDEWTAFEIEEFFIKKFGRISFDNGILLNLTPGGYNEGGYIRIGSSITESDIRPYLTDEGKRLLEYSGDIIFYEIDNFRNHKIKTYFEIVRSNLNKKLSKVSKPIKPWPIPIPTTKKLIDINELSITVADFNKIESEINFPIENGHLPNSFYFNFMGRINTYFEQILVNNIDLYDGSNKVSVLNSDINISSFEFNNICKLISASKSYCKFKISEMQFDNKHNSTYIYYLTLEIAK